MVRASLAAFTVYAKYPIRLGLIPSSNFFSTLRNRYSVLPVPGGPKIILVDIRMAPVVLDLVLVSLIYHPLLV